MDEEHTGTAHTVDLTAWRTELVVGSRCDFYDGALWREGRVIAINYKGSEKKPCTTSYYEPDLEAERINFETRPPPASSTSTTTTLSSTKSNGEEHWNVEAGGADAVCVVDRCSLSVPFFIVTNRTAGLENEIARLQRQQGSSSSFGQPNNRVT